MPVKIPPPMLLQSAAKPQEVDGKSYDLVVIGGTPGGIACAVRAALDAVGGYLQTHFRSESEPPMRATSARPSAARRSRR